MVVQQDKELGLFYIECQSTDVGAQAVSNREYEDRIQDEKRQIKLLDLNTYKYL